MGLINSRNPAAIPGVGYVNVPEYFGDTPAPELSKQDIACRVDELGPWIQPFEFEGVRYFDRGRRPSWVPEDGLERESRTTSFYDKFPNVRRILELGACEGADTVHLASRDEVQVVAIEAREENARRAAFVLGLHGLRNVELIVADVETTDLEQLGRFDAAVCSGLLYHVVEPWALLETLARITDQALAWTHYWGDENTTVARGKYRVKDVVEDYPEPRLSGISRISSWLSRSSLFEAIADSGFTHVETLEERGGGSVRDITLALRK